MLGKVLKYDLKWVYKVVVVFYVLAVIFSVLGRAVSLIENSVVFSVVTQILFSFAISMVVSSLINCIMRLWARVTLNMYKDESYLTHTIPVEKKKVFTSKVLAALITIFTTIILAIICLFICYYSEANMEVLKSFLEIAATTYNTTVIKLLLLVSLVIFLEIMFMVLIGYVGIIFGHKSNKNKMLKSIIIGFVIYMAMQVLILVAIAICGLFNPEVMNLLNTTSMADITAIKKIMYLAVVVYGAYILVLYALGIKQLNKGVNVD